MPNDKRRRLTALERKGQRTLLDLTEGELDALIEAAERMSGADFAAYLLDVWPDLSRPF